MNIKKYKDKNGNDRYKFRAYLGKDPMTGKELKVQKGGFLTKTQAKAEYLKVKNDVKLLEKKEYTFTDVFHKWFAIYETSVKPSSAITVERHFELHILPFIGKYKIDKIKTDAIQNLTFALSQELRIYKTVYNYMNQVFEFAKKLELISRNPCDFVAVPRVSGKEEKAKKAKFWTSDELNTFLSIIEKELDYKWNAFFRLLAFTGMRKGEILVLKWNDIDFEQKQIIVSKTMTRAKGNSKAIGEPKTKSGNRIIDVDEMTIKMLKTWRVEQNRITNIVFTNSIFDYYVHSYPDKVLNRILNKHNLAPITIHSFRHTHCSLLIEAGASIKEVQDRLGHSDIQTTMNIYAHVSKEKKQETIEKFVEYLSQ